MSGTYQIRAYTPAGVLTNVITDFLAMSYVKGVNEPGMCSFTLNADDTSINDFELDAQIEVWRRDSANAIDWYVDFYGLWRGEQRAANSDGTSTYTAYCPGQMSLLDRAVVAYYAQTSNRSVFAAVAAETIAKTLVTRNATSSGTTADGRMRTVTLTGISVEADAAAGEALDFNCAWRKLLPALQEIALIGGGDFDLVKTAARAWEFRWYDGQLGTDRSATVTFALQYGNMANPVLERNSVDEKTVAIAGGQGEETARVVAVATGANYHATENAVETFVEAREMTSAAAVADKAARELEEVRRRDQLTFDVLQVPSTLYGLHYGLGDLVTGYYQGVTGTKKIQRVTVSLGSDGQEKIVIGLADV